MSMWSNTPYMTGEAISCPLNPRDPSRLTSDFIAFPGADFAGIAEKSAYALTIRWIDPSTHIPTPHHLTLDHDRRTPYCRD